MTLPISLVVRAPVPFPTRVTGAGFLVLTKVNGVWQFTANYRLLTQAGSIADPTSQIIAIQDSVTGAFSYMTVAAFLASEASNYRIVTAAGDVAVGPTDATILLNKTVGAATNVNMPASAARNGVPVTVKDYKRDANTNNVTFVLSGVETIDGLLQAAADTAGLSKIDINGDSKTLYPLTAGGYYTLK